MGRTINTDLAGLETVLRGVEANVQKALGEFVIGITLAVSDNLAFKTAVDRGDARSNWFLKEGPNDGRKRLAFRRYPKRSQALGAGRREQINRNAVKRDHFSVMRSYRFHPGTIVIFNNLPYIERLDRQQWSQQNPLGMTFFTASVARRAERKLARKVFKNV